MRRHRQLLLGLSLSALLGLAATEARSGPISMSLTAPDGDVLVIDTFAVVTYTSYVVSPQGISVINAFLMQNGSAYQFNSLAGTSNFPGGPGIVAGTGTGFLEVNGNIQIPAGGNLGTSTNLILTETQLGFTTPSGTSLNLTSTSTGTFTNVAANGGYQVLSAYNSIDTFPYDVNPSMTTNSTSILIAPSLNVIPYSLTNVVRFDLAPSLAGTPVNLVFDPQVKASAVPEPSSLVLVEIAALVVGLGMWSRRRLG
jgi:hypothetical protein